MKNNTVGSGDDAGCQKAAAAFKRALRMITGKWTPEILWHLSQGTLRFGALRAALPGITQHMLTAKLRELEANGLVHRRIFAEVPPRVEYSLTPASIALHPVFESLGRWAAEHMPPGEEPITGPLHDAP